MVKRRCAIATNLDIDDKLLNETVKAYGFKSKKQAVNTALQELLNKKKRLGILELMGTVEYYPDYDYKKLRGRKKNRLK